MNRTAILGYVFLFFFFTLLGYGCGYHSGYGDAVKIYRKMSDEEVRKCREWVYGKHER